MDLWSGGRNKPNGRYTVPIWKVKTTKMMFRDLGPSGFVVKGEENLMDDNLF